MPRSTPQQESASESDPQPFLIAIFPYMCLAISLLFLAIVHRKRIAGFSRYLYLPHSHWFELRMNCSGSNWMGPTWGFIYTRVDGEDHDLGTGSEGNILLYKADTSTSTSTNTPTTGTTTSTILTKPSNPDSDSDSTSNSPLSKYFHPETSLLYKHILEPPSPSLTWEENHHQDQSDPQKRRGNYHNNRRQVISALQATSTATAEAAPKAKAKPGWLHNLVEVAVRGFESLHDANNLTEGFAQR